MDLKIRKPLKNGMNDLVTDQLDLIRFSVLCLDQGQSHTIQPTGWEQGLILIEGECRVSVDGKELGKLGPRKDVFSDPPWGVYVPGDLPVTISAISGLELAVAQTPWEKGGEPKLVGPDQVVWHERGKPGFERRVADILLNNLEANSLLIGETFNEPGQWSSYPPHKHENDDIPNESLQEEVYYYKFEPRQGFGFQRIYTDDRSLDETLTIEQSDVSIIPKGYHPVAAAPGYKLYYLWILAGPKRKLCPKDDPNHAWAG